MLLLEKEVLSNSSRRICVLHDTGLTAQPKLQYYYLALFGFSRIRTNYSKNHLKTGIFSKVFPLVICNVRLKLNTIPRNNRMCSVIDFV